MKKHFDLKAYFGMVWWALTGKKRHMLVEKCERCGSANIEMSGVKTVHDHEGNTNYYSKYLCRRCGASAISTEIWQDDNLVDFVYKGVRKRGCGCCIINEENKILLGLRCKSGDKPEWGLPGGQVENTERPQEAMLREIKEECGLNAEFVQYVGVLQSDEWDDFIYVTNSFTGELVNQPEEIAELKWCTFNEAMALQLYPDTRKALDLLVDKGLFKKEMS